MEQWEAQGMSPTGELRLVPMGNSGVRVILQSCRDLSQRIWACAAQYQPVTGQELCVCLCVGVEGQGYNLPDASSFLVDQAKQVQSGF